MQAGILHNMLNIICTVKVTVVTHGEDGELGWQKL